MSDSEFYSGFIMYGTSDLWKAAFNAQTDEQKLVLGLIALDKENENSYVDWEKIARCSVLHKQVRLSAGLAAIEHYTKLGESNKLQKISEDTRHLEEIRIKAKESVIIAFENFVNIHSNLAKEKNRDSLETLRRLSILNQNTLYSLNDSSQLISSKHPEISDQEMMLRIRAGLTYVSLASRSQLFDYVKNNLPSYVLDFALSKLHTTSIPSTPKKDTKIDSENRYLDLVKQYFEKIRSKIPLKKQTH